LQYKLDSIESDTAAKSEAKIRKQAKKIRQLEYDHFLFKTDAEKEIEIQAELLKRKDAFIGELQA
jgi:hypothetical protein